MVVTAREDVTTALVAPTELINPSGTGVVDILDGINPLVSASCEQSQVGMQMQ